MDSHHVEEIRPEVAAILEAEGVIHKNEQGEELTGYVVESKQILFEALADVDLWVCDFCSSPDVTWTYPAEDMWMFRSEGVEHMSRSDWAACEICHHLIEQQLYDDLNDRAAKRFYEMTTGLEETPKTVTQALLLEAVRQNTVRFEKHRTGPPVRVRGGEEDD
jgi:hypothetical protein